MKDWHKKPPKKTRSVDDAMLDAERQRNELPHVVQVYARDWDKVILADEVARLRLLMPKSDITGAQRSGASGLMDGLGITHKRVKMKNFEKWLRTVCFQPPTKEAYDLAKSAWIESAKDVKNGLE